MNKRIFERNSLPMTAKSASRLVRKWARSLWAIAFRSLAQVFPTASIANQLRYGLVLLVALTALIAGGVPIAVSFQTHLQQSLLLQQERSQLAAQEIDGYLDDLQRKLSYLARVRGLTNLSRETQQSLLEALIRHNSAYEMVALLDGTGQVVASVLPYISPSVPSDRGRAPIIPSEIELGAESPVFLRTFKRQEDYVGPVEIDPQLGVPVVTLAVPVRNARDRVDGVLVARINLEFLWFIVSQTEVGSTGYAYVIDNRYQLIAVKGSSPETSNLEDLSDRPYIQEFIELTPETKATLSTYKGLKDIQVLGVAAPVRSVHWKVIVELPTAEAYAPLRQTIALMAIVLLMATGCAIALGIFFSQEIVSPLRHLTAAATEISRGNLNIKVRVRQRNEMGMLATTFDRMTNRLRQLIEELQYERNFVSAVLDTAGALIVVLDRQGRIIRFNHACEQSTGYSFDEVKDRYVWDIFLVPEEIDTVRATFEELRSDRKANGYENYWLTKEGQLRLISWSNTVLLNRHGKVEYVISIGIDVTEQKQAEELRQAKETAEAALRQLQQTQSQLIQSEKMSSLGQMVAGIAHEINNPVNFIGGNISYTETYIQDLLKLVNLYQKQYPEAQPSEIEEYLNEIDFDFLVSDLSHILSSMKNGADRIGQIVLSLRNFSHLDEAEQKPVNLNEGVNSTLLILHSRLREAGIAVVKDFGEIPLVNCYGADLNQVFLNILSNAIDAFENQPEVIRQKSQSLGVNPQRYDSEIISQNSGILEMQNFVSVDKSEAKNNDLEFIKDRALKVKSWNEDESIITITKSKSESKLLENTPHNSEFLIPNADSSPTIRISTETKGENLAIVRIADNGVGMKEEVRNRVFDPFFTTKPVGKGTGLGLYISYQIVVDKHGGSLRCESKLGEGTEFLIEIPIQLKPRSPVEPLKSFSQSRG